MFYGHLSFTTIATGIKNMVFESESFLRQKCQYLGHEDHFQFPTQIPK